LFTCYLARVFKKNKVNLRRFLNFFIFAAISVPVACTSDREPIYPDQAYLPAMEGVYQIYDVDSLWYTPSGPPQEIQYELLTEVVDSFLNVENKYTYVLYRYRRNSSNDTWQYIDTWSIRANEVRVIMTEGSTDFVKFVIPPAEGIKWDGNAFNTLGKDEYELINARKPATVNEISFPDCIEVNQNNDDDIIVRTDIRREVYARDVGLILKEITILNYCTVGCSDFGQIETGTVYTQKIKAYGVNM
jgi:hypothetical protein